MGVRRRITLCTALLVAVVSGLLSASPALSRPQQVTALPKTCVAPKLFRHVDAPSLGLKMKYGKLRTALDDPIIAAFDIDETLVRTVPDDEWKALRAKDFQKYSKKFIVLSFDKGVKVHYEVRPGALSSVIDMHRLGFEVHVFSAGAPKRNEALLKAIKMPRSNQSLYDFVGGRLSGPAEIKINLDPFSEGPELLKPLDSLARKSLAAHRPHSDEGSLEYGRRLLAMRENSFLLDNIPNSSPHQIAIPDETIVGTDWPQYREYVLGVVAAARDYSMAHPHVPLGTAITQIFKKIPPDYYIVGSHQQFAFSKYFVKRGREEISRHRFTH